MKLKSFKRKASRNNQTRHCIFLPHQIDARNDISVEYEEFNKIEVV